jgi:hypothetical protein
MVGIRRRAQGSAGALSTIRDDVKPGLTKNEDVGAQVRAASEWTRSPRAIAVRMKLL